MGGRGIAGTRGLACNTPRKVEVSLYSGNVPLTTGTGRLRRGDRNGAPSQSSYVREAKPECHSPGGSVFV
jgi:hypothetical protein